MNTMGEKERVHFIVLPKVRFSIVAYIYMKIILPQKRKRPWAEGGGRRSYKCFHIYERALLNTRVDDIVQGIIQVWVPCSKIDIQNAYITVGKPGCEECATSLFYLATFI